MVDNVKIIDVEIKGVGNFTVMCHITFFNDMTYFGVASANVD